MPKIFKKIFILLLLPFLVLGFLSVFLPKNNERASAQVGEGLTCQKTIPIGEAMDKTVDFTNNLYVQLQNIHKEVGNEINTAQEVLNTLGKDAKNCDFSVCKPKCIDIGPSFDFNITILWGIKLGKYPACFAVCEQSLNLDRICGGDPCPHFDQDIKEFEDSQNNILTFHNNVKKILYGKTENIEEDIMKPGENLSTKVTQAEFIKRKLDTARRKFSECALSEPEMRAVGAGEIPPRISRDCVKAMQDAKFWPTEWPKVCQDKCTHPATMTADCENCLCSQTSRISQVGCRIYSVCKEPCAKDPGSIACQRCICNGKSAEDCIKWVCGSLVNWTCCY